MFCVICYMCINSTQFLYLMKAVCIMHVTHCMLDGGSALCTMGGHFELCRLLLMCIRCDWRCWWWRCCQLCRCRPLSEGLRQVESLLLGGAGLLAVKRGQHKICDWEWNATPSTHAERALMRTCQVVGWVRFSAKGECVCGKRIISTIYHVACTTHHRSVCIEGTSTLLYIQVRQVGRATGYVQHVHIVLTGAILSVSMIFSHMNPS